MNDRARVGDVWNKLYVYMTTNRNEEFDRTIGELDPAGRVEVVNFIDDLGNTLLHHAMTRHGKRDARNVAKLLKLGANPNIANDGGLTPLMSAVWKEEIEPVKVLVRHPGIDLTITDHEGSTALEMGEYKEYEYRYVCEFDEEEVMSAIVAELKGVGGSRRGTMKRKTMKRKTMKRMNLKADRVKKLK